VGTGYYDWVIDSLCKDTVYCAYPRRSFGSRSFIADFVGQKFAAIKELRGGDGRFPTSLLRCPSIATISGAKSVGSIAAWAKRGSVCGLNQYRDDLYN
jgi:hypothetical protein